MKEKKEKKEKKGRREGKISNIEVCPSSVIDKLDLILISIQSQTNKPFYGLAKDARVISKGECKVAALTRSRNFSLRVSLRKQTSSFHRQ